MSVVGTDRRAVRRRRSAASLPRRCASIAAQAGIGLTVGQSCRSAHYSGRRSNAALPLAGKKQAPLGAARRNIRRDHRPLQRGRKLGWVAGGHSARPMHFQPPENYLVVESVVVVVTGAGTVVCCVVLVVVCVGLSVSQPVSDNRAAAANKGRMNFFMMDGLFLCYFQPEATPATGQRPWGITRPYGRRQRRHQEIGVGGRDGLPSRPL